VDRFGGSSAAQDPGDAPTDPLPRRGSPRAPAALAPPRSWSERIGLLVGGVTVLAMVADALWLPDLMRLTGAPGAYFHMAFFGPAVLLGLRHWRQLLRRESASLVCVMAYACVTAAWSGHPIDSAVKIMHFAVLLGLVACFRGSAAFVRAVGAGSTIAAVLIPVHVLQGGGSWVDTRTGLPLLAISITLYLHRRATWRTIPLLAAVIVTTLRASIIGAVAGLALTFFRSWRGRLVVAAVVVAGALAWSFADVGSTYRRPAATEREDIIGRFMSIEDDGASHRFDLWSSILDDIATRDPFSREMLVGWGIGDVNYHVARVFPLVAVDQRDHEPMASSHNTLLELYLIGGLAMVPLVVWMILDVLRFTRIHDMTLPIAALVAAVAGGNEMFMGLNGVSALIALLFGVLTRADRPSKRTRAPPTPPPRRSPPARAA
jgi:O-Antigen ligase